MSQTVPSIFYQVIVTCLRIVATRGSPEALPYSKTLFYTAVFAAALVGVVNRILIPDVSWVHALVNTSGEVVILLVGLYWALTANGMSQRFHKVASAMFCISALGGSVVLVLGRLPETLVVNVLIIASYIAQLSGAHTCLHHGLNTSWISAGLYLFAYLWSTMVFFNLSGSLLS